MSSAKRRENGHWKSEKMIRASFAVELPRVPASEMEIGSDESGSSGRLFAAFVGPGGTARTDAISRQRITEQTRITATVLPSGHDLHREVAVLAPHPGGEKSRRSSVKMTAGAERLSRCDQGSSARSMDDPPAPLLRSFLAGTARARSTTAPSLRRRRDRPRRAPDVPVWLGIPGGILGYVRECYHRAR